MRLYKSNEPNTFHYVTLVTHNRVPVFRNDFACEIFVDALRETNPVRAGLCNHPATWKWSSYKAYLPHEPGEVPIETDWRAYWKDEALGVRSGRAVARL